MARAKRKPTDVEVHPLNFDDLNAQALEYIQGEDETVVEAKVSGTYGVIMRDGSPFAILDTDGVGKEFSKGGFTTDMQVTREVDGKRSIGFGGLSVKLTPESVVQYMTDDTVNLAEFVRVFGSRLEANYDLWRRELAS